MANGNSRRHREMARYLIYHLPLRDDRKLGARPRARITVFPVRRTLEFYGLNSDSMRLFMDGVSIGTVENRLSAVVRQPHRTITSQRNQTISALYDSGSNP